MNENATSVWGNEKTRLFDSLEPHQILRMAEVFGVKCTGRTIALNSMENRVYQIEIELEKEKISSSSDIYKIIKFYRPGRWSYEQIEEEHIFLKDLVEAEYPVVLPMEFEEGYTIYHDKETDLYVSMFPKIGGRNVDEIKNSQLPIVGRLLSRLHLVGRKRDYKHRLKLDIDTYGDKNLDLICNLKMIPHNVEDDYIDLVEELLDLIEPHLEGLQYQRVHGDCHLGNLLDGSSGLFWVDFDDSMMAPPVQDVWLIESGRDDYSKRRLDILLEAYNTFSTFDNSTLKLFEPLRTLRLIHFAAWIGKRYQDNSFKRAYPDYESSEYWLDQIATLREQAELISKL